MRSVLTGSPASASEVHIHLGPASRAARVGHFVRHYFEMCLAMCLGFAILNVPFYWAARAIGSADPLSQFPELSALVIAFNMSAPMAAWMRHRGMDWGSIVEMSGVMVIEALVLIGVA